MKKSFLHISFIITLVFVFSSKLNASSASENNLPFSINSTNITVWNGSEYIPFFIKGVNFGVALPGRFPGELEVKRSQYAHWLEQIKDAGFNVIRLYTLHYPHFYEILDSINRADPQHPLFIFQGIWLDETTDGYSNDLYELSDVFSEEIENNVHCVHGNRNISHRYGKAYGPYTANVSQWVMGYIIAREIYPGEVLATDLLHSGDNSFTGNYLSIDNASATETWLTGKLDYLLSLENDNYNTQRPVSVSSWPTLDPMCHPGEYNPDEDTTYFDLGKMDISNAGAGYFASFHAYPYYPDFISRDEKYQDYVDVEGQNPYLGYLTDLKQYYSEFPLIIAEFGVPSSWGVAHYSNSGMHHGGYDETEQGKIALRMFDNIEEANGGGGILFSWIDEWFKRTWITDPLDFDPSRRILWHNVTASEQNFGLIGFNTDTIVFTSDTFCETCPVQQLQYSSDYAFFYLNLELSQSLDLLDTIWIGIDSYDEDLGESVLPNGEQVTWRAEFALSITNYGADLFVTEAYDLFGKWHGLVTSEQKYQSIASDGGKWNLVRWKNNAGYQDVQYIGKLQVKKAELPASSKDAVTISNEEINIKLPWSLLQFIDPSQYTVMHDDKSTSEVEDTTSTGIAVTVFHNKQKTSSMFRYLWDSWNTVTDIVEFEKTSYKIMQDNLEKYNTNPIAFCDSIILETQYSNNSVMDNDFDMDGDEIEAILWDSPQYGRIDLSLDGSFIYIPDTDIEKKSDNFSYILFDGYGISSPAYVFLDLSDIEVSVTDITSVTDLVIYPNPSSGIIYLKSNDIIKQVSVFDINGKLVGKYRTRSNETEFDLCGERNGIYTIVVSCKQQTFTQKVIKR
jgi:hypothetical protein